jgi:hypothetical protein
MGIGAAVLPAVALELPPDLEVAGPELRIPAAGEIAGRNDLLIAAACAAAPGRDIALGLHAGVVVAGERGEEPQAGDAVDVGEQPDRAGVEGLEVGAELVGQPDPVGERVFARADRRAQQSRSTRSRPSSSC